MAAVFSRNRPRDEEGESVFVSMTDLTVSFLFIILILLAFFATQYKPEETVSRDEYDTLIVELSKARHVIWQFGRTALGHPRVYRRTGAEEPPERSPPRREKPSDL